MGYYSQSVQASAGVDHKTSLLETEAATRKNVDHLLRNFGCLDDPNGEGCDMLESVEQGRGCSCHKVPGGRTILMF